MKSKGLIALLLATALAVIAAVVLSFGRGGADTDPQVGQAVLPEVAQRFGDIAHLTLAHGEGRTTLLRQGDRWVVAEKGNYPADGAKLHQTLLGLAELRYVEPKTRKPDFYARLEVEDVGAKDGKSTLVTVSDDKGTLLGEIIAGKRRLDQLGGGTDGVYIRKPGNPQSWLARGTLDLPGDTAQWLDRNIVDVPREKVKEEALIQPDGSRLVIAHDKPEAPLALKDAPANAKLKSDTALVEPTTALTSLTLSDVRPAKEMVLPPEGVSRAEITTFDGLTIKIALIDQDKKSWARFEASGSGAAEKEAQALNARLSPWVFAIPEYKAKALRTKLADVTEPPKPS
jgi:uncharacterized protein DUF4340